MQLHALDLAAIGPFPDTVSIDLAAVAQSGVFLLEGPTGSGKSTLIDAIVFALYGSLAGDGASTSKDRLHSHHARPTTEPFVELVFQTGAGVFRVRRTPQYQRPKQRGTGTVLQQASARLWRLADPSDTVGEPISDRAQDVGAEITRIVGLDRAQFVQTVVLPQGEFARFLRSPGEERRALLQSLFGTEIYERTTAELVERRRAAAAAVDRAASGVELAIGRFAQAAGLPTVDETETAGIAADADVLATEAEARAATARAATTTATTAADLALGRHEALQRRRSTLERRDALDARADAVAAARDRLALAERASRVVGVLVGHDRATTRVTARRQDLAASLEQHRRLVPEAAVLAVGSATSSSERASPAVDTDVLDRHVAALGALAAGARHLVAVEQELDARADGITGRDADLERLTAWLADLDRERDARPAARAELVGRIATLAEAAADLDVAVRALDDARALGETLLARDTAATTVERAAGSHAAAVAVARAALDTERDLLERRFAGLAGELADSLADGDPCPVCGSVEHPALAALVDDHPTPERIDAAADARSAADRDLAAATTALEIARADLARLEESVGDADAESVADALGSADLRVRAARTARDEHADAVRRLDEFDAAAATADRDHADAAARIAADTAARDADRAALERDRAAVAAAIEELRGADVPGIDDTVGASGRDTAPLAGAIAAIDGAARTVAGVADLARSVDSALADADARAQEVAAALAENDFDDVAAARAGALDSAAATELRATVAAADRERAVVDAVLAEPAVAAAAGDDDERIGLQPARAEVARATAESDEFARAAATARATATATSTALAELTTALAVRDRTSAESRAVVRLADIASAAPSVNPTGITLGTYVLMRRFEDVVAAANDRLTTMLGGRFTLETSDERESSSRARRTGLALAVRDHAVDRTRDPKSLSGGETFTVSLCLALGLADVVTAEAGGVSLGTLFVDEGFGTLDPSALDGVLDQLARLTTGGRQVGIVSHVEELKRRIADRIEVRPLPTGGSSVRTTPTP